MKSVELKRLYKSHKANCCKCGCTLEAGVLPLGSVFVLDKDGNFYCSSCDSIFEDGDERIFDLDVLNESTILEDMETYGKKLSAQSGNIVHDEEVLKDFAKRIVAYEKSLVEDGLEDESNIDTVEEMFNFLKSDYHKVYRWLDEKIIEDFDSYRLQELSKA